MTPDDMNGWPKHAIALYERLASVEATLRLVVDRMDRLPCIEHEKQLAINTTRTGMLAGFFGVLGGALAAFVAWFFRGAR